MKWNIAIKCAGGEESVPQPRARAAGRSGRECSRVLMEQGGKEGEI